MTDNTDYIRDVIAHNLKRFREDQKLSMDQLATLSGVSKSMIGQIERAETSSSVSTLWKIASGLHVPFTALIEQDRESIMQVSKDSLDVITGEDGRLRLFPYFPISGSRNFEVLYLEMDPGAVSQSDPHAPGTVEYLIVFGSTLELFVGTQKYEVQSGNAISFAADQPHMYHNNTDTPLATVNIIYYKNN